MAAKPLVDFYPPVRQLKSLFYGVTDGVLTAPTPCPGWSVGDLLDHLTVLTRAFTEAARKVTDAPGTATPPPAPSSARLHPQWRGRLPAMLDDLATAWADPPAWTGTAQAGGVTMPADRIGIAAVNELTVHGWDLAKATGQDFAADPRTLLILATFLATAQDGSTPAQGQSPPAQGGWTPAQRQPPPAEGGSTPAQRQPPAAHGGCTPAPEPLAPVRDGPATIRERPTPMLDEPAGGSGVPFDVDVEDEASLLDHVVTLSGRDPRWRPS